VIVPTLPSAFPAKKLYPDPDLTEPPFNTNKVPEPELPMRTCPPLSNDEPEPVTVIVPSPVEPFPAKMFCPEADMTEPPSSTVRKPVPELPIAMALPLSNVDPSPVTVIAPVLPESVPA
jgi:hypothetical protein